MNKKKNTVGFFKQKSYMLAMVLMLAAVFGMAGVYFSEQQKLTKQEQARQEQMQQEQRIQAELDRQQAERQSQVEQEQQQQEETAPVDAVIKPESKNALDNPEAIESRKDAQAAVPEPVEEARETIVALPELHFDAADELMWPLIGNVIMNYSMDQTTYFATLDQYKLNPAIIIQGNVNDKVLSVADGRVERIYTDAETGHTVMVNLGDGFQAIYGQLKEVSLSAGDMVSTGDVIGYISEPTKYYSIEGANLYFELRENGESVNPMEFLQ